MNDPQLFITQRECIPILCKGIRLCLKHICIHPVNDNRTVQFLADFLRRSRMIVVVVGQDYPLGSKILFFYVFYDSAGIVARIYDIAFLLPGRNHVAVSLKDTAYKTLDFH